MTSADSRHRLALAIDAATERLAQAGVASPRVDARALAAHVLGVPQLVAGLPPVVPESFEADYATVLDQRSRRVPLQHIVGTAVFRYLTVEVRPGVFIPRPETELVAQAAIDEAASIATLGRRPLVVDLCTGSGVIAISIASEVARSIVLAVDINPTAVALAGDNARTASVSVSVSLGDVGDPDLLASLAGTIDVVVSNPPYVAPPVTPLEPEVQLYDPPLALFGGGTDGLDLPRRVVTAGARLLRGGGLFVMEHDDGQGDAVRALLAAGRQFIGIATHRDLTGRDRFVVGRRTEN